MSTKTLYRVWMTFLALVVIFTVYFMIQGVKHNFDDKLADQKAETDKYVAQAKSNGKKFDQANGRVAALENQVKALGKKPAATPVVPSTSRGLLTLPFLLQGIDIYCTPRNHCVGKNGKDAKPAMDGKEGPMGPVGPAGPKGDTGDKGDKGDPAPTVTNIVCNGSTGVFTFSDGATINVDNMCNPPLVPTP